MAYVAAAGMAIQAYSSYEEGNAKRKTAFRDARIAEENAALSREESKEDARRTMIIARKEIGDVRANYAASGVGMTGSALDILAESQGNARLDELTILRDGENRAKMYEADSRNLRQSGQAASNAGKWRAAGQLVQAGASAYSANSDGKISAGKTGKG